MRMTHTANPRPPSLSEKKRMRATMEAEHSSEKKQMEAEMEKMEAERKVQEELR